jgi:RNA polymerase sigma-70 factor (ECF subfamily)
MTTTSESLLQRLKNSSDSIAWNRFVELYVPMIFLWGRRTGMQPDDASDLVQDVLAVVIRRLSTFHYDPQKSFRAWLKKVTINQYRSQWRRKKRGEVNQIDSWLAQFPDLQSLESSWDVNYRMELIQRAMDSLSKDFAPKTWIALRDLFATHDSVEEVARRHSLSIWTLYSAKTRLIRRLKSNLDGLLD